jgi:hypothetical protein
VARNLELDHLYLPIGEDVGLPGRRDADDAGYGQRGLELGGDDEVDVEKTLTPDSEVLLVGDAGDRLRIGGEPAGEQAGDEIDLVVRGAGDEEVGGGDTSVLEHAPVGAVALDSRHAGGLDQLVQALVIAVDDRELVLAGQSLEDRRSHLPGSDYEDLHLGLLT